MTLEEFRNRYHCPQLRSKNLIAAYEICRELKEEKCLSNEAMIQSLIHYRKGHRLDRHPKNFENIHTFLQWHGMYTRTMVNGLVIYVATQKCFRAKEENWFIVKQEVTKEQILKALEYQKINNGKLNFEVEGKIIAENILELTGETKKEFVNQYIGIMERCQMDNQMDNMDRAIINPTQDMKTIDAPYISYIAY